MLNLKQLPPSLFPEFSPSRHFGNPALENVNINKRISIYYNKLHETVKSSFDVSQNSYFPLVSIRHSLIANNDTQVFYGVYITRK